MIAVRRVGESDRTWLREVLEEEWGSVRVVSRGRLTEDASILPGFVAELDGRPLGFALIRAEDDDCEVVVLQSLEERRGAGTALLHAVQEEAERSGWRRVWLVTTNDNLNAIGFYQRRAWELVALHRDALTESRRLKPEIGEVGESGIPIRHELEFEAPSGSSAAEQPSQPAQEPRPRGA